MLGKIYVVLFLKSGYNLQLIVLPAGECEIHGEDEKLGTVVGGVLEELGPGGT